MPNWAMSDWIFTVVVSVVGLLLIVFGWQGWRTMSRLRPALAIAGGIVLVAAAAFASFPPPDNARLVELRRTNDQLESQRSALARDVTTAAARRMDAEAQTIQVLASVEDRVADIRSIVRRDTIGLAADLRDRAPVEDGATRPLARLDRVLDDLDDLKSIRSRPRVADLTPAPIAPTEAARIDRTRDLIQLKEKLAAKLETDHYDVEVFPDRELVGGRRGRYYVVDLKNASSGIRYYFEGGRYTLPQASAEFRTSLNTFIADVLKKVDGHVRYDLFVRGSADAKPYAGRFEPGYDYQRLTFMRALGGGRYSTETASVDLAGGVRNSDLPNLRATYLSRLIADVYPVRPPTVLEGVVSPQTNGRDRNAELILYVDW